MALKKQPKYNAAFTQLISYYKRNSKKAGVVFNLSNAHFMEIIQKDCFYCGHPPSQAVNKISGSILYNGIDRLSPKGGYTKENCVASCKRCNWMKGLLSVEEFLGQVQRVVRHLKSR